MCSYEAMSGLTKMNITIFLKKQEMNSFLTCNWDVSFLLSYNENGDKTGETVNSTLIMVAFFWEFLFRTRGYSILLLRYLLLTMLFIFT